MDDTKTTEVTPGKALGWALLIALVVAVSVAISLAVQLDSEGRAPRATPPCGGLYDECCADWDDNWGPCVSYCDNDRDDRDDHDDRDDRDDRPPRDGLFDAEANFADRRLPNRC